MFEKLKGVEARFIDIENQMGQPEVLQDRDAYAKLSREHAELGKVVTVYRQLRQVEKELAEGEELLRDADPDIKALARDEVDRLTGSRDTLTAQLKQLLIPKDPLDAKNVMLEIRAGTGGEEAACSPATFSGCTRATPRTGTGRSR
jgi:peptide chain release factor 1